jgi:hypothetical protein
MVSVQDAICLLMNAPAIWKKKATHAKVKYLKAANIN